MDKYMFFPHLFVHIDICKHKCTFAGVDIYYLLRENTGVTTIPRNWAYHGIEHPHYFHHHVHLVVWLSKTDNLIKTVKTTVC